MSWNTEGIQKNLKLYLKRLQKVLKKDISWMPRQNTIVLVYRDENETICDVDESRLAIRYIDSFNV